MTSRPISDVVVLAGGLGAERDISLRSGRAVLAALRDEGASAELLDLSPSLLGRLREFDRPVVVPLLHGAPGEDGAIRAVLDTVDVPYLGASARACRVAFDKPSAKYLLSNNGVLTPESVTITHGAIRELGAAAILDNVIDHLGLPVVVKPTQGGSSLGLSVVRAAADLSAAVAGALAYADSVLIERLVIGTEVAVGVVEDDGVPHALPAVAIAPISGIYDYTARYTPGATEFVAPAMLDAPTAAACADLAVAAHSILGLRDWSRADLIVDSAGQPWFLEVNVAPGCTETSTYPLALKAAGRTLGAVLVGLISRHDHLDDPA